MDLKKVRNYKWIGVLLFKNSEEFGAVSKKTHTARKDILVLMN
jgi:hypothetical protein